MQPLSIVWRQPFFLFGRTVEARRNPPYSTARSFFPRKLALPSCCPSEDVRECLMNDAPARLTNLLRTAAHEYLAHLRYSRNSDIANGSGGSSNLRTCRRTLAQSEGKGCRRSRYRRQLRKQLLAKGGLGSRRDSKMYPGAINSAPLPHLNQAYAAGLFPARIFIFHAITVSTND